MISMNNKPAKSLEFESFDPIKCASNSLNYLTKMTDEKLDYLPYWLVSVGNGVAFAEHNRVDDAELVASWYEGISCAMELIKTTDGADVEEALYNKLLDEGWDEKCGLRFPIKRPWNKDEQYTSIHEQAYVLSALVRAVTVDKDDKKALDRAKKLVDGLFEITTELKSRALWCSEQDVAEYSLYFLTDVYVKGKGFDPSFTTGFGDSVLRNSAIVLPLVDFYELTEYEPALKLATGIANYLTTYSHYFNFKMEYYGHVHSAMWFATGIAKLGKITLNEKYIAKAKAIYDYTRRHCSSFGWLPEYLQWQLMADERCDVTCIKDMIMCALALVDCGFPEFWDDVHRFWRNQLAQSQIVHTDFINQATDKEDTAQRTYSDMKDRVRGAMSGAAMPNGIELVNFNMISGNASASAPVAMLAAYKRTLEFSKNTLLINFPVSCENEVAKITVGYPNSGSIIIKLKRDAKIMIRIYPWMPAPYEGTLNGRPTGLDRRDDILTVSDCKKGDILEFRHELKPRRIMENVGGMDYFGIWRGPDMIDILPHGNGYRTYQKIQGVKFELPTVSQYGNKDCNSLRIITEPQPLKETRLNRRRASRS